MPVRIVNIVQIDTCNSMRSPIHCPLSSFLQRSCACIWLLDEISSESRIAKRRRTHLEDIGDSDGVLRGLALGGDDGDGRPRHGVLCGRVLLLVSLKIVKSSRGPIFQLVVREASRM